MMFGNLFKIDRLCADGRTAWGQERTITRFYIGEFWL